jgi:hypothetical protein
MSKRPAIDLMALTTEKAEPMREAIQRVPAKPDLDQLSAASDAQSLRTENLEGLNFKVPPAFRRRFRQRAATADLKLNELLFQALDAWETAHGIKR